MDINERFDFLVQGIVGCLKKLQIRSLIIHVTLQKNES